MFRRLLGNPQEELYYRMLKTVTLFDYTFSFELHMGLQLYLQLFKNPHSFNVRLKMVGVPV
jgi:hypothetical protein